MLSQEKKNREVSEQAMLRQHQSLLEKHGQLEKEMYLMMSEQQREHQKLLTASKQSEEQQLRAKNEQQGHELSAVRGLIGSVERKLEGEINTKLRNEADLKQYIDARTERIREELVLLRASSDDGAKGRAEQPDFVHERKQGVHRVAVHARHHKQATTRTEPVGHAKRNCRQYQKYSRRYADLSKSIDAVRDTLTKKVEGYLVGSQEAGNRYGELRAKVIESLKAVEERLREIEERSQTAEEKLERQNGLAFEEILKKIEDEQLMTTNWKSEVERKNLIIFKEISGTLKVLKSELAKEKEESQTRDTAHQK